MSASITPHQAEIGTPSVIRNPSNGPSRNPCQDSHDASVLTTSPNPITLATTIRPTGTHRIAPYRPDELKSSVGSSTLQLQLAEGADQELARQVVRRIAGAEPVLTPESGRMNVPLDTADRAADVLIGFRQAGVSITSVSVDKPTLDEVFLAITGHGADPEPPAPGGPDAAAESAVTSEIALEVQ